MSPTFRCSGSSEDRGEPLHGTASTVRAYLLVEVPGPWGSNAVLENRLPRSVMRELSSRSRQHGVRPLAIRRHGRPRPGPLQVYVAHADPARPWAETTRVEEPEQLLDIDLAPLGQGRSPGLTPHHRPLFLVCTHGRHDVCCAERGRPVAAALAEHAPEDTWEVSHIGGDRFAGNLLILPEGLYYGRLDAASAVTLASRHRDGWLDLERLRGRSGYPFGVQAAEILLRRLLPDGHLVALSLDSWGRRGEETTCVFRTERRSWTVRVRSTLDVPERLTCRAPHDSRGTQHTLVSVTADE